MSKVYDIDTILALITNSNSTFIRLTPRLEKIIFHHEIISPEIPEEYQKSEIEAEEEFKNRYIISAGSISLAIVQYLIIRNNNNTFNIKNIEEAKKIIFTNKLKVREKIMSRNQMQENPNEIYFYDTETLINYDENSFKRFSKRIDTIADEISLFIRNRSDIQITRNYFGVRMGQIIPDVLPEKNEQIGDLIKMTIDNIVNNMQALIFDLK